MTDSFIRILDETTINQIAAGEVIEHPASVVKELIENALDAASTRISIETKGGGKGLICVTDNGIGMNHDDLLLSVERHATSKISTVDDLNSLNSLGFRGEALPSIASVSKLLIHSSKGGMQGNRLHIEGGKILSMQNLPRQCGTTIEVRSLFYNVPVRKKFQKSNAWDTAEIHKILIQCALCHHNQQFTWVNDEKKQFEAASEEPFLDRIQTLLGQEYALSLLPIQQTQGDLQLFGYLGRSTSHKPNRRGQYLFVNKRPVFSPFISKKIEEGYGNRLPPHRFPAFVLHLTLPPSWIDVNVHPQKKEIRLRHEEQIGSFLLNAVEKSLQPSEKPLLASTSYFSHVYDAPIAAEKTQVYKLQEKQPEKEPLLELPLETKVRVLAKLGNYLLVEQPEGILVVDGQAARARVIYEQLLEKKQGTLGVQHLLLPYSIEISGAEKAFLLQSLDTFEAMGISIRPFGGDTFIIDAIPSCLEIGEIEKIVQSFLEEGVIANQWLDEKKAALRLTRALNKPIHSMEEGAALVEKLFRSASATEAPDGSLISFLLTEKELSKWLKMSSHTLKKGSNG